MDFTLKMFDDLLTILPRKKNYKDILPHRPDLQLAISDLYQEFVRLGVRVIKTFGHGKVGQ